MLPFSFRHYPPSGFDDSAIAAMIEHAPQMAGLVLSLYGTGNGPSHKEEFMKAIERAVKKDIAVIAVTQVGSSSTFRLYFVVHAELCTSLCPKSHPSRVAWATLTSSAQFFFFLFVWLVLHRCCTPRDLSSGKAPP